MTFDRVDILHHGGVYGVTGSCHELVYAPGRSLLVDCGLFQGSDHSTHGEHSANADSLAIDFDLSKVQALFVTHAHIDHIGRIPYLLMAGFDQPIVCSESTARILPFMLEDAVRLGVTKNARLISAMMSKIQSLIVAVPFKQWWQLDSEIKIKFKPAGHILGSAYLEIQFKQAKTVAYLTRPGDYPVKKVVFSGDLGAPYAPLLPSPQSPYGCDLLVLESTYGDRLHEGRKNRRAKLKAVIENCVANRGVVLIPAFSLGRTQALLYEFEQIIHQSGGAWEEIEIVVDSPLANDFTKVYRDLKPYWDQEAKRKLIQGRHPLAFEQMTTIDDHQTHQQVVEYLRKTGRPTIVIAASGMCTGGRIVAYLKALIEDKRTDIVFAGYQAEGTPGSSIQKYGDKRRYPNGYVELDGQKYSIRAGVHTISGYSAHADQKNLINFVKRMRYKPSCIRLVHGDKGAKATLAKELEAQLDAYVEIP